MENLAWFQFHGNLNDFLPKQRRFGRQHYVFPGQPAVKDAIEALGIPHPEVNQIVVNGKPVTFSYKLQQGDDVQVYPLEVISGLQQDSLIPKIPKPLRMVLDVHLGKLARWLRLLGFDTVYRTAFTDQEIADLAVTENRLVLTRDVGLLKQKQISWGYWLRSQNSEAQLTDVIRRFGLQQEYRPFTRCLACNGEIVAVEKSVVIDRLPPKTRQYFHEFYHCLNCHRVYWKGSHYEHMQAFLQKLASF